MIFEGKSLSVTLLDDGIADIVFDAAGSVNKFDKQTLDELAEVTNLLKDNSDVKGAMVRSAKNVFIVGADITEFGKIFALPDDELLQWTQATAKKFDAFEDLPFPTIAAINGYALGGGCEMTLACDLRIADTNAAVGLPEVKLGLIPGFGGTVRLPRVIGADNAMEWMTTGKERKPQKALQEGAVDAVVAPEKLQEAALAMLKDAIAGKLDWKARRELKLKPLTMPKNELMMSFSTAKGMVFAQAGKHYPAPHAVVNTLEKASVLDREGALKVENEAFAKLAKTDAAKAQIGIFLADQFVKGSGKKSAKQATKQFDHAAVLGAGIMGGGIAYQAALKGTKVVMKDIAEPALELGLNEAASILGKGMKRGKVDAKKMAATLNNITPSLEYSAIKNSEIVIEAVVENEKIKGSVLKEVEENVTDGTVICSNTSTISITRLAESLSKPENFCGMHFFNPVHKMPLVEIIRGEKTSEETINNVVAMSLKMGKTPIVVNDCPGFLVNRVLFPYFAGFSQLLLDGADFVAIDKVMEKQFGWPMGPAYLLDVVGIDTADHASDVMAQGFPERMQKIGNDPVTMLYKAERYGQKNGVGFYEYSKDKRGRPVKTPAQAAYDIVAEHSADKKEFDAEEIMARLMVPMANEAIRCLEEGIVNSVEEADMALLYGIGFPPFRGGIFRYIETMGLQNFVALAEKYEQLGPIYQLTDSFKQMAADGKSFFNV
ncbi:fatty acid oxidation complex subunit alpha FadB [Alteromonas sp. a30]|uniref:fatty acid oxidation complex subunit alpha FadB n=1 Tax=Alteromonas sp. a30 TaxID=2730917 RepID=UPI002280F23D|nr:fatty acid oxidation complex subunit alpha FadB [Alteromonas sp. a30]MCY7294718.1 fatty acid oxidation complex subunit alpha FadB [Alteromonas sp. a30]